MPKVAKNSGVIAWAGGTTVLRKGQSIDDDHPLLADRPELFEDGENHSDLRTSQAPPTPRIETTQAEGPQGGRVRRVQGQ